MTDYKQYLKYVFYAILLGALFFVGRCSKPDVDLVGWEKEKQEILERQQSIRDKLNLAILNQAKEIVLLEEKDSLYIIEIEDYQKKDVKQDRELKAAYNELRKLGSIELTDHMIKEYEKNN